jgi:hypothetical protein
MTPQTEAVPVDQLRPSYTYRVTLRPQGLQRTPRQFVGVFLGHGPRGTLVFSFRPLAGTTDVDREAVMVAQLARGCAMMVPTPVRGRR